MKIRQEHLEHLRVALADRLPPNATMRQRWDALYAAGLSRWICDNLYSYMNDTHIDTALRSLSKGTTKQQGD